MALRHKLTMELVHTEVEWSDSVEAAEYVLFADLLMRLLDRAAERVALDVGLTAEE